MSEQNRPSEQLLTPEERDHMIGRTVVTARLFLGGADLSPHGEVLLTDEQLDNAYATGDPFESSAEQQERAARAEWLTTPIEDILVARNGTSRGTGHFNGLGLMRISDVLAYGRTPSSDIDNVGIRAMTALDAFISENPYGVAWPENPTLEDVARICPTLGDVPRVCLRARGFVDFTPRTWWLRLGGSIQDLLNEDGIENNIGEWGGKGHQPEDVIPAAIEITRSAVVQFAEDFALARIRVDNPELI